MDSDQIAGKFRDVAGQAEAAVGDVTGDRETQFNGRIRQAAGVAQNLYGQANATLGDALGDASKSAETAFNTARETVEQGAESLKKEVNARPLIALLIAALVGYVVASLLHTTSTARR